MSKSIGHDQRVIRVLQVLMQQGLFFYFLNGQHIDRSMKYLSHIFHHLNVDHVKQL